MPTIETKITYMIGVTFPDGGAALFSGVSFDGSGEICLEYLRRPNDDDATICRAAWHGDTLAAAELVKGWLDRCGFSARFSLIEYQGAV